MAATTPSPRSQDNRFRPAGRRTRGAAVPLIGTASKSCNAINHGYMADKDPRINHRIRASEVRVIGPDGDQLGVMTIDDAREKAEEYDLDLVEVAPNANPPVCRILDYGKFKYQQKKRTAEARKKSSRVELKEVKLRPKTDEHDFLTKLRHARKFLEENNKVKVTIMFRGREITHPEIAQQMLVDAAEILADVAEIEQRARLEGRNMTMTLTPRGSRD